MWLLVLFFLPRPACHFFIYPLLAHSPCLPRLPHQSLTMARLLIHRITLSMCPPSVRVYQDMIKITRGTF